MSYVRERVLGICRARIQTRPGIFADLYLFMEMHTCI